MRFQKPVGVLAICLALLLITLYLWGSLSSHVAKAAPSAPTVVRYVTKGGVNAGNCNSQFSPCATISYALSQATADDTLLIDCGQYTESLVVNKSVTISNKWPGSECVIISAPPSSRVVEITGTRSVQLTDLTIANGSGIELGGGILVGSGSTASLTRVTIGENQAEKGGCVHNAGALTITDSVFRANTASFGGAIHSEPNSRLVLTRVLIEANQAVYSGAGIYTAGEAMFDDLTVVDSIAGSDGGGLLNWGALVINNSDFTGNAANAFGGAIHNIGGDVSITQSTIKGNSARAGGGIAQVPVGPEGWVTRMTIADSVIDSNEATGSPGSGWGGGISNCGNPRCILSISGSVITVNEAASGAGIRNRGILSATNTNVMVNLATEDGGGIYNEPDGDLTLVGGLFEMNEASRHGAGIYTAGVATVRDVRMTDNIAEGDGGGIYALGRLDLTATNILGNAAGDRGGGIWSAGELWMDGGFIESNFAQAGGGVYSAGLLAVDGTHFLDNAAADSGGGIHQQGNGAFLLSPIVIDNAVTAAQSTGGGITFLQSASTVRGGVFWRNAATKLGGGKGGGGIANIRGTLSLEHVVFGENKASGGGFGGAVLNSEGGGLEIDGAWFTHNSASSGGAIANGLESLSSITQRNSTLSENDAFSGGGIYNTSSGVMTIANSTFSANTAPVLFGGAIANGGDITTHNSTLAFNSAPSGGGLENSGNVEFHNVIVANNDGGDCVNSGSVTGFANLDSDGSCPSFDYPNQDPQLLPLADNGGDTQTHALPADSPAIDAGNNFACLEADQRGISRPEDGNDDGIASCDIGAYERGFFNTYLPTLVK